MTMATWRYPAGSVKVGRKQPSQTPGSQKGTNCQADAMKKFFAKRARSYKDRGYSQWCRKYDGSKR